VILSPWYLAYCRKIPHYFQFVCVLVRQQNELVVASIVHPAFIPFWIIWMFSLEKTVGTTPCSPCCSPAGRGSQTCFFYGGSNIENTVSGFSATAIFTRIVLFHIQYFRRIIKRRILHLYIYKLFINLLYYINKLTAMQFFHSGFRSIFYNIAYSINIHRNFYTTPKKIRCSPTQNTCPDGWMFNSRGMCQMPASGNGAITTGDTTATSNLIKATGVGYYARINRLGVEDRKTAICAKHAGEQIRRHVGRRKQLQLVSRLNE
jgi:hypothetical protein